MTTARLANAQIATGTTAAGMGNAGRASVDPGENSWLNPAALAQARGYFFGMHGSVGDHAVDGNQKHFALTAADNEADQIVAGSLSYIHKNNSLASGNVYAQDLQIAAAGLVFKGVALGVSVHRLVQEFKAGDRTQYDGTVGLLYSPIEALGFALVEYDLVPQDKAIPDNLRLIPTLGLGANWVIKEFMQVRLDLSHPSSGADGRTDVMAGVGTYFQQNFAFRFGADFKETKNQTWATAGIGFTGPKLSLDYAFQKDIRQADGYRHLIDLWMPF